MYYYYIIFAFLFQCATTVGFKLYNQVMIKVQTLSFNLQDFTKKTKKKRAALSVYALQFYCKGLSHVGIPFC